MHSPAKSVLLHLLPGAAIAVVYFSITPIFVGAGLPSIAALMAAVGVALVPTQLGYMLYQGKRATGSFTLQGIVLYRDRLPARLYVVSFAALFMLLGVIFTVMKPVDSLLQAHLFRFVPVLDAGLDGGFSRLALIVTYLLLGVFGVVIGPLVEEWYFRGYLLPRMQFAGRWALLLHSFLFALYHFWTPWMVITRTLGILPLAWAAQKRSLYLAIGVHIAVNSIDLVTGIVFINAMGR